MKKKIIKAFVLFCTALLCGCSGNISVNNNNWRNYFSVTATHDDYFMYINIRGTTSYDYSEVNFRAVDVLYEAEFFVRGEEWEYTTTTAEFDFIYIDQNGCSTGVNTKVYLKYQGRIDFRNLNILSITCSVNGVLK